MEGFAQKPYYFSGGGVLTLLFLRLALDIIVRETRIVPRFRDRWCVIAEEPG